MLSSRNKIIIHIIGMLVFLSIPIIFPPYSTTFLIKECISYFFALVFFYINYYYLVPTFYFTGKTKHYIIILSAAFVALTFLPLTVLIGQHTSDIAEWKHIHKLNGFLAPFHSDIKRNIFLFATAVFASIAFRINDHLIRLNKEKINAELSYLKAQMNPHFLFNTLNSIYSLAIVQSDKTASSIVKLSSMMRYTISETADKFVSLEKEMSYVNSYIDLQKMRLGETAIVNFSCNGDMEGKVIAPLVLIPFIENAFKHGVNPEEPSQIDIQISISEKNVYLHVFNLKVPHRIDKESKSGLGLENGKNQLAYLYPNKHELKIDNTAFSFTVNLNLTIV